MYSLAILLRRQTWREMITDERRHGCVDSSNHALLPCSEVILLVTLSTRGLFPLFRAVLEIQPWYYGRTCILNIVKKRVEPAKAERRSKYITFLACGTYRPNCQLQYDASAEIAPSEWPAPLSLRGALGKPPHPLLIRKKEVDAE
jgi:hypothetical protein